MSTFVTRTVACPSCGMQSPQEICEGLNGPRVPWHRRAIVEDRFQRFPCARCGQVFSVEDPFTYVDFDAHHWITMAPPGQELAWRAWEERTAAAFQGALVDHAAPVVRPLAPRFMVRVVFGLDGLRDKLVSADAALDDALLEATKLDLMRSEPGLVVHPSARLSLLHADGEDLVFTARIPDEHGAWRRARITVGRDRYDRVAERRAAWEPTLALLSGGAFVDVGRVLIGGAEPLRTATPSRP